MIDILTIGHSTLPLERFIWLLQRENVSAVADVRSQPSSRRAPHFDRGALTLGLRDAGIQYVFLGRELGGRPSDQSCYENGQVQYARLAKTTLFQAGINRLQRGAATERIAVMCAEREPLDCHRTILVSQVLERLGLEVAHLHDEAIERHSDALQRLRARWGLAHDDLFHTSDELLQEALRRQEAKIAYTEPKV